MTSGEMAKPDVHFLNWKNSCAIDSFLELAQFTFYPDLTNAEKGDFLTLIYDACYGRDRCPPSLPGLRDRPWSWLQRNASTFSGCTNDASFEQILDFMCTTSDEKWLFTTSSIWAYSCSLCYAERVEEKKLLPIFISADDVLQECGYDLEQTINETLYHPQERTKTCRECGNKSSVLRGAEVEPSKYLFVRIPTLVKQRGGEPKVLHGIQVKEEMTLNGEHLFELCGAVRGVHQHFSVTVQVNDGYSHIDDVTLNVKSAKSFAGLTGQSGPAYTTNEQDGYFLFIYKYSCRLQSSVEDDCSTALSGSTCSQADSAGSQGIIEADDSSTPSTPTFKEEPVHVQSQITNSVEYDYACDTRNSFSLLNDESDSNEEQVQSPRNVHASTPMKCEIGTSPARMPPKKRKRRPTCQPQDITVSPIRHFPPTDPVNLSSSLSSESGYTCQTPTKERESHLDDMTERVMESPIPPTKKRKEHGHSDGEAVNVVPPTKCAAPPPLPAMNTLRSPSGSSGSNNSESSCNSVPSATQSPAGDLKQNSMIFPNITLVNGRPFVSLRYCMTAISTRSCRRTLYHVKSRNTNYGLDNNTELHPRESPSLISLKAFIYLILKSGHLGNARRIRDHIFQLLRSKYDKLEGESYFVGFKVFSDLDENRNVFLTIEDCYSLCGHHGSQRRYRPFLQAAELLGLNLDMQVFNATSPRRGRVTHINISTLIAFLFQSSGSKCRRVLSQKMVEAIDVVTADLEELVAHLPPIPQEGSVGRSTLGDTPTNSGADQNLHSQEEEPGRPTSVQPNRPSSYSLMKSKMTGESAKSNSYSRTMARRVKKQKTYFSKIAQEVHSGGKESFKNGILYSLQHTDSDQNCPQNGDEWSGTLTCEDLLDVLDGIPSKSGSCSVLQDYVRKQASELFHMDARTLIAMIDNHNSTNIINHLRTTLPNFLDSRKKIRQELDKLKEEFEIILKPTTTSTGYRVDPHRLSKCLQHLYYFIPKDNQLWKIWGDARETGGKKACSITVSSLNNEMKLNGLSFHSPKDIWPICLFYGGDGRWNLEGNIGGEAGQPGWLDDWISKEQGNGDSIKFFLTGDSMFLDAVHGKLGELAPNSKTGYNIYSMDSADSKHETGAKTGFRSELNKQIDRSVPNSLMPSIPLPCTIFCIDHATTRIVEKLIQLRLKSIVYVKDSMRQSKQCKEEVATRLGQFKTNMINRMVSKADRLEINPDGSLKEKLTLNKRDAHALLLEADSSTTFSPLLHGVALTTVMLNVDEHTQRVLQWPTQVSEYDLETAMWTHLSRAIFLLRKSDPDPIIKPQCQLGSPNAEDYLWGLQDEQVKELVGHIDIFHKLFIRRYGGSSMTPYMMKLVDFTSVLLHSLPVKSLMRFATEGGEHLHYMDNCYYYQHTQRGGSYRTRDPLYSILFHRYRVLQNRLQQYSEDDDKDKSEAGKAFLEWVERECSIAHDKPSSGESSCISSESSEIPPVYNFILVGRVPPPILKSLSCKTKDEFLQMLQKHKSRVVDVPPAQLPKIQESITCVVLTSQSQCDKPTQVLITACKRKWPIISYAFCPNYIANPFTGFKDFSLGLPSQAGQGQACEPTLQGKDYFFKVKGPIHPVTLHKKRTKKKIKPGPQKKKLKRPGSGYARFVAQELGPLRASKPDSHFGALQTELSQRWKCLSDDKKVTFHNMAQSIFEENRDFSCQVQNLNIPAYK